MNSIRHALVVGSTLLALLALAAAPRAASAQLNGTDVTGFLGFTNNPKNFFDTANSDVPATGYGNSGLPGGDTTVTIGSPAGTQTFGQAEPPSFLDVANFTNTQLVYTFTTDGTGVASHQVTFTDTDFLGLSLVSDNFPDGGWTSSIAGDEISLDWAGGSDPSGTYTAVWNISAPTGTPEPGALALFTASSLGLLGLAARKARHR